MSAIAVRVLMLAGVVMVWTVTYLLFISALQQSRDQDRLYAELREQLAQMTAPMGGLIDPGSPVALLQIPSIGLVDAVVVEGTSSGDLRSGPGHRRDTVLPGQAGVSVIDGRGAAFGAPFGDLGELRAGSSISVTTGQGSFRFTVLGLRRAGDPLPAPMAAGQGRLTLVTSEGSGWRTGWAPSGVLYADAQLEGTAVPAPAGHPGGIPAAEKAMQGDPGALVTLVLWLQLLGVVGVAAMWIRVHWGNAQAWLIGAPVVLAVTWGCTNTAVQLLPNLL
jgi:sortase A